MIWTKKNGPGILYTFALAVIASLLGYAFPLVGGPVFGIVIGILLKNTLGNPARATSGIVFTSKQILQWAIIVLGSGLSLSQVWKTGVESFSVMMFTLLAAFVSAYVFGKWMNVPSNLTSLVGVGTAICGGSAIAAISPIIKAKETEIAYAISTVFFMNIIAVLTFPALGHWMGLTDYGFGLWAGTAINDTSSVVAAAYVYSDPAGAYAAIVKLTRTTLIIPIALLFAFAVNLRHKRSQGEESSAYNWRKVFPWFIVWFLVASLLNTLNLFSDSLIDLLGMTAKFMITMALCAIGLSADVRSMMKNGFKPLALGFIVWAIVVVTSLIVQSLTGQL